jgi:hypothetical protein
MSERKDAADEPIAAIVAAIALIPAIYLALFRIDWTDATSPDSLFRYILPVAFCIIVPSIIGTLAGAVARTSRR